MTRSTSLSLALLCTLFTVRATAAEDRHEAHGEPAHQAAPQAAQHQAPRPAPPHFQAHPPGVHPHGPMVRQHPVRVLAPRNVVRGHREWAHWEHPEFARPSYFWAWGSFQSVSCIAEDSYGDQYPVTESAGANFGLMDMTATEDDAMDRCYAESGEDASCYLATCSHF
jgi:hypothetical protein